jgi:hypothetical protein
MNQMLDKWANDDTFSEKLDYEADFDSNTQMNECSDLV